MTWGQKVTLLFELTTKVSLSLCSSNGWKCDMLPLGHNPSHPDISNYRVSSV